MGEGRGSALLVVCIVVVVVMMGVEKGCAATTFTVGNSGGWTFNVAGWPKGKTFRAGDTLVFNYNPGFHNVVAVSRAGYQTCTTPRGSKVYSSGQDKIKLVKGQNFFICSVVGHCQSGMKIAVTAT